MKYNPQVLYTKYNPQILFLTRNLSTYLPHSMDNLPCKYRYPQHRGSLSVYPTFVTITNHLAVKRMKFDSPFSLGKLANPNIKFAISLNSRICYILGLTFHISYT